MEHDDTTSLLDSAEFFAVCDSDQRRLLAFASEMRKFEAGDVIYASGDPANGAHVLARGTLAVTDDPERPQSAYKISLSGSLIGEMGLLLKRGRRATVTAVTRAETLFVPQAAFQKLMQQHPDMAKRVATRIEAQLGSYLGALDRFRDN